MINVRNQLEEIWSIWPIDETLTDTTAPGQNEPKSNLNERVTPHSLVKKTIYY